MINHCSATSKAAAILLAALVLLATSAAERHAKPSILSPVILMPGYGGSKLEARWNPSEAAPSKSCPRFTEWRTIWLDPSYILPNRLECLVEMLELEMDTGTCRTRNKRGLEVRVKAPERVENAETLTDLRVLRYDYFHQIVDHLVKTLGYKRNENIRGAPYDFRRAPNELAGYYERLDSMVAEMIGQSGGARVTLVCHSMGCLNALYYLHSKPQDWRDKHIRRLVSLAAPWGGSLQALRVVALGFNMGPALEKLVDALVMSRISRSFPSTYFLLPREAAFKEQPLVVTKSESKHPQESSIFYQAKQLEDLIRVLHRKNELQLWRVTKDLLDLGAPGVETHCLFGERQKTLSRIRFTDSFPWSEEIQHFTDGDGTVTLQSAGYCRTWIGQQEAPVSVLSYHTSHSGMLKHGPVLKELQSILSQP